MIPVIDKTIVKKILIPRQKGFYYKKYTFGLMLVIGGSDFYSGSPALNALAGFRAGVDMVRIFAPERASNIIASFSPVLASFPLEGNYLQKKHLSTLLFQIESAKEVSKGKCSLVIGGGMGRSEETQNAILELLEKIDIPVVIDADGIYALAQKKEVLSGKKAIVTPHMYEFFILTGERVDDLTDQQKTEIVQQKAKELGLVILLKSKPDIISDGNDVFWNKTGSPFMSVGGTGDVLAGVCGCFLAQGKSPLESALAGVYITCVAGEIAEKKLGAGLTAIDVVESIAQAVKEIQEG